MDEYITHDQIELERQILLLIHSFEQKYKDNYVSKVILKHHEDLYNKLLTKGVRIDIIEN